MLAGFAFGGSGCEIVEGFLVAVNIQGLVGQYVIPPTGILQDLCTEFITPDDYLDSDFSDEINDVQIYDIRIKTEGAYNGTVSGEIRAMRDDLLNPQVVLTFSGSWEDFKTPQSWLQARAGNPSHISPQDGAIAFLINAIRERRPLRICADISASPLPVPAGLAVTAEVFGQVRVAP